MLHFREITPSNRAAVEALSVLPAQGGYVVGVAGSLREAASTPDAAPWYRALYDDDTPVGFVMLSDGITEENMRDPDFLGPYFLWRLLIDHRYQGRGYGAGALALAVAFLRSERPDARVLLTSCGTYDSASPYGFYLRQGFQDTGTRHQGEAVLALTL
jgi:diamine N-acetyltransferase